MIKFVRTSARKCECEGGSVRPPPRNLLNWRARGVGCRRIFQNLSISQVATSFHGKEHYNLVKHRAIGVSDLTELERNDSITEDMMPVPMAPLPNLARLKSEPDDTQDENEQEEEPAPPPDNQTLLRLLQENEKVILSYVILYK